MLPVRIELTTSALPRMRSTTELRQHVRGRRAYGGCVWWRQPGLPATVARISQQAMTSPDPKRAERLAEALRDNLRRRKAQAREGPTKDEAEPAGD